MIIDSLCDVRGAERHTDIFGSIVLASDDDGPAIWLTAHRADVPSLSGRMTDREAGSERNARACIA